MSAPALAKIAASALASALPNPTLTPGALNLNVTQANIHSTICVPGWTAKIRPSSYFTDKLKRAQIKAYGYADTKMRDYEEDHKVSLELGGAPRNPKNLWPQPYKGIWGARAKDHLEDRLHKLVCADKLPLAAAQQAINANWIAAFKKYVGKK